MQEHAGDVAKGLEALTYSISIPITLVGAIDLIDHHTWIVGAFGMTMTFLGNMFFKWLDYRRKVKCGS